MKSLAITTGGGDAPGLNAVIRAVVMSAHRRNWQVFGIRDGYDGLLFPERYPAGGLIRLLPDDVRGIASLGGTILGTTNRGNPFRYPVRQSDGSYQEHDLSDALLQAFGMHKLDALVAIGGDGSMAIAHALAQKGLCIVGVPKTIDNDLAQTVITFGFDTAVSFATEAIDRLHTTAASHRRVMVVEVMGRYAGWIALNSGVSGSADVILIPEIPYDIEIVAQKIRACEAAGQRHAIVVVAEGARPGDGDYVVREQAHAGHAARLGGVGERVAADIAALTGKETRVVVLGHLLRGGSPTTFDRLVATRFGAAAVRALDEGQQDVMVALAPPTVRYVPLEEATRRMKTVPLDSDTICTARDLGICFGD
ncbi:MAG: 6-phosphofructokinase [Anaerolineales bacterium]